MDIQSQHLVRSHPRFLYLECTGRNLPRAASLSLPSKNHFFLSSEETFFFKLIFDVIKKKLFCYFDIFFYHCYEICMYILLFVIVVLTFWRFCRVCWLVYGQTDRLYNSVRTWSYTLSVITVTITITILLVDKTNCWYIHVEYVLTYVSSDHTSYICTYSFAIVCYFQILRFFI